MRFRDAFRRILGYGPRPCSRIVLYTRAGCHLCDDAKATIQRHLRPGERIEEVDIDERTEFLAPYHEWVPVVEIDGVVRFRGGVNEVLLKRLLANR